MADETIQDNDPEIPPASVPKPRREPVTIDGEAVDATPPSEEVSAKPEPDETVETALPEEPPTELAPDEGAETRAETFVAEPAAAGVPPEFLVPPDSAKSAPGASLGAVFAAAGAGAILGAVIALGGAFLLFSSTEDAPAPPKVAAIDSALAQEAAARKALEDRLSALENKPAAAATDVSPLAARIAKLESEEIKPDALAAVSDEAKAARESADKTAAVVASLGSGSGASPTGPNPEIQKMIADQQQINDRVAKLETQVGAEAKPASPAPEPTRDPEVAKLSEEAVALSARVAKLESAAGKPPVTDPELVKLSSDEKLLTDRVAKVEASLAAPKTEARADPAVGASGDPVAQSVAAIALERRLLAGQPFSVDLAALERLGARPDALATLKPYAETGAPTLASLSASFAKLAPTLGAPAKAAANGEYAETLWGEMKGLVKSHPVGEIKGDDPMAVTSQIQAALARGDLAAVKAGLAKYPPDERPQVEPFEKDVDGAIATRAAALTLIEAPLSQIATHKS